MHRVASAGIAKRNQFNQTVRRSYEHLSNIYGESNESGSGNDRAPIEKRKSIVPDEDSGDFHRKSNEHLRTVCRPSHHLSSIYRKSNNQDGGPYHAIDFNLKPPPTVCPRTAGIHGLPHHHHHYHSIATPNNDILAPTNEILAPNTANPQNSTQIHLTPPTVEGLPKIHLPAWRHLPLDPFHWLSVFCGFRCTLI